MFHQKLLATLLGKRIKAVIAAKCRGSNPQQQLFLIFEDDNYVELFGDEFEVGSSLQPGGESAVMHYLRDLESEILRVGE